MSASPVPTGSSPLVVDDAFARVHMPFIRRVARRMGVPEADLDDAVQETMLAAMTSAHTFEAGRHERAWLFGIARNCARRVFRRAREVAFAEPPEQAVSGGQQRAVAEQQARSLVHRALDELPEAQRDVVVLHALEGWAMPRVAEALGCSEPTAHSRYRLARARIGRTIRGRTVRAQLAAAVASLAAFFSVPAPAAAATVVLFAVVGVSAWALSAAGEGQVAPPRTTHVDHPAAPMRAPTPDSARGPAVEVPLGEPHPAPATAVTPSVAPSLPRISRGSPPPSPPIAPPIEGTTAPSGEAAIVGAAVPAPVAPPVAGDGAPPNAVGATPSELRSLALEGALLRRARAGLVSDPATARATLREYRARFPAGRLQREADQLEASLSAQPTRE